MSFYHEEARLLYSEYKSRRRITTHSTRRLDSMAFIMLPCGVILNAYARRGLIRALCYFCFGKDVLEF